MNAAWENARCMHGNVIGVCFAFSCAHPIDPEATGDKNRRSDLAELLIANRDGCDHPRVPNVLSREAEATSSVLFIAGRLGLEYCPDCRREVGVERPARAA